MGVRYRHKAHPLTKNYHPTFRPSKQGHKLFIKYQKVLSHHFIYTKKLANTNINPGRIFLLVYCDNLYRYNSPSMYLSVNTNIKTSLVYTKGIAVGT
jgi:hypothetical protein